MTFRIAQISDTHLSAEKPFFVANFERVGEALRATRPDLVVNSGDISLSGKSKESDLAAGGRCTRRLACPCAICRATTISVTGRISPRTARP